jgi:hypothetical protein
MFDPLAAFVRFLVEAPLWLRIVSVPVAGLVNAWILTSLYYAMRRKPPFAPERTKAILILAVVLRAVQFLGLAMIAHSRSTTFRRQTIHIGTSASASGYR